MNLKYAAILSLIFSGGCSLLGGSGSVDEDNYIDKLNKASCSFEKRCATAEFFYYYSDVDDCIGERENYQDDADIDYGDCDFDDGNAKDCLDYLNGSCKSTGEDYDKMWDKCREVWDCGYYY